MEQKKQLLLKQYYGYDSFRPGQEEIIDRILAGQDVLAVMPTGAGKSICYQLPALLLEGVTIVLSPLISLMKDQVQALKENGIPAAFINSSLDTSEIRETVREAAQGRIKLLYLAPERLDSGDLGELLYSGRISMLAVDEAHCISQWGQDFRPSYRRIPDFVRSLPYRPVLSAFTATATARVREDILAGLMLRDPYTAISGFDRPNLFFRVETPKDKLAFILDYAARHATESGIIYCATRKQTDQVYLALAAAGVEVTRYHAGLSQLERRESQEDFLYDRSRIMVATNAFGMGIDKSNVRFVLHYSMPGSLEDYYQEAGRAGRDGEPAECVLLYAPADTETQRFLLTQHNPELLNRNLPSPEDDFFRYASEYYVPEGFTQDMTDGFTPDMPDDSPRDSLPPADLAEIERSGRIRLEKMRAYCLTTACYRKTILEYFGENAPASCGSCANCCADWSETDVTAEAKQVINCIYETRQRYGASLIAETLAGKNNTRTRKAGTVSLKTFGRLSGYPVADIQGLIDFLLAEGYLEKTMDRYPLLKLTGRMKELADPDVRLTMRNRVSSAEAAGDSLRYMDGTARPDDAGAAGRGALPGSRKASSGKGTKGPQIPLSPLQLSLFEQLRVLRASLARQEKIPPFVVFSDRSLHDMCEKLPLTRSAFLTVSGVGLQKSDKYGDAFVKEISEFAESHGGRDALLSAREEQPKKAAAPSAEKGPFRLLPEEAAAFTPSAEPCSAADLAKSLQALVSGERKASMERLFGTTITRKLTELGYIQESTSEDSRFNSLLPTTSGTDAGLAAEARTGQKGKEYFVLRFAEPAQTLVLKLFTAPQQ